MTDEALAVVRNGMTELSLDYAFMEWKGKPVYPYFVGEYQEIEGITEDGLEETSFIITGFGRSTWAELETAKNKIKNYFGRINGRTVKADNGSVVTVFYLHASPVPIEEMDLKKLQINLLIKEWKVNE